MKTLNEKMKICSVCTKRAFDARVGLVCSLTNGKPQFEENCEHFEADSTQMEIKEVRDKAYEETKTISGWLAFFLWVGIGCGALLSVAGGLVSSMNVGFGWLSFLLYVVPTIPLAIIAIYAIRAFYQRKSNAVALAMTYVYMIGIAGLLCIVLSIILDDASMCPQAIRSLCWSIIWYIYLRKSERVEMLIPPETRTRGSLEKTTLIIYIALMVLLSLAVLIIA